MRALAVGGVVGYIGASILFHYVGREWGCLILAMTFGTAWLGHSERSRAMVGRLLELAEQHFGCAKVAADKCGVSASRWSEWKSGEEQASLPRLVDGLPDVVWNEWHSEILTNQSYVVAPSGRLASATAAVLRVGAAAEALASAIVPRQGVAKVS